MSVDSIIGMMRRRWQSERPFQGHTKESLLRKLQSPAVRSEVKDEVRRELDRRAQDPLST